MDRLPPSHLEQGSQGVYCDMNYQLNHHNFSRIDQPHHLHQPPQTHHHHHPPGLQRLDAVRRSSLQHVTATNYGHLSNYQNIGNSSNNSNNNNNIINSGRHIYEHYTQQQQVPTTNQQMYVQLNEQQQPANLYHMHDHDQEGIASYDSNQQASYSLNMGHMQHQEPMQTTSHQQLYTSSVTQPLTPRVIPQIHQQQQQQQQHHHHHHHTPQQQQHFQYNGGVIMLQQQQSDHLHAHHHQEDYHQILNPLPEHLQVVQQPHQHPQPEMLGLDRTVESNAYDSGEIIDQNEGYYQQQEQMDLLPTIKQQQQLQQQQQQLHLRSQQSMGIDSTLGIQTDMAAPTLHMTSTYGAPSMRSPDHQSIDQAHPQHLDSRTTNLMINSQSQQQQLQAGQLIPRSKSDLATPVVYNNGSNHNFDQPQRRISLHQNQRPSSTTSSYTLDNNNRVNNQQHHQNRRQQHQQHLQVSRSIRNESTGGGGGGGTLPVNIPGSPGRANRQDEFVDMKSSCGNAAVSQDWLDTICPHLIDHMNQFGICVIDDFLGKLKGELVLKEVLQLYNSGQYTRGRLVSDKLSSSRPTTNAADEASGGGAAAVAASAAIRNDRVIWIDGYEDGCSEINNLIQTLCSVITNSSRLSLYSNNGLDKLVINKRTKAHVACYPGNGTRYIKHVDNPNNDGRVITSIYYLNKDWDTKRDGGLLRMFPNGMNEVANIEPLFDRALFFWSDRRNPHEVLPAYRDRFAITVWYIGENRP